MVIQGKFKALQVSEPSKYGSRFYRMADMETGSQLSLEVKGKLNYMGSEVNPGDKLDALEVEVEVRRSNAGNSWFRLVV